MDSANGNQQSSLNQQQAEAMRCPESVLVLSGAGTGKTRVIIARMRDLLMRGVEPRRILAVTFSNKAASELKSRIGRDAWGGMIVCTFHSFGRRLLEAHAEAAGLPKNFQILDTTEQTQLMRRVLVEVMEMPPKSKGGPDPLELVRKVSRWKDSGLRAANVQADGKWVKQEELNAYGHYERLLAKEGKTDFAELLLRSHELLRNDAEIRRHWAERFSHILIDELQDINLQQFKILQLLRRDETVFFGVGDDDQSIYRFRGAVPKMLDRFANDFTSGKIMRLEENYRSTKPILDLANNLISKSSSRLDKTLRSTIAGGDPSKLIRYPSDIDEARATARWISEQIDEGVNASEIAVLYRIHSISQLLESELRQHGVPFQVRGSTRFFARAEVKDAIAYLRLAAWPDEFDAMERSIRVPPRKVGPKKLEELKRAAAARGIDAALEEANSAAISKYLGLIRDIRAAADKRDLAECARLAVSGSGLIDYFRGRHEEERADNLGQLISAASRFEEVASDDDGLSEFLNVIALDDDSEQEGDKVSLMTIHAAKGLEFEKVCLVGFEEGILPNGLANKSEELEEERRLLYVAATRAKNVLRISLASKRRRFGRLEYMEISSLVKGVDAQLLDLENIDARELHDSSAPRKSGAKSLSAAYGFNRNSRANGKKFHRQPPPPEGKKSLNGYFVGQKVASKKFGPGVILALAGAGEKAKAKVLFFRDKKQRWLLLALAGLSG